MNEEEYYNLFDLSKEKLILKIKLLQQENQQLKEENERYRKLGFKHLNEQNNKLKEVIEEVRKYMEENRTRYIYQDSLGEDWRFDDLDVYSELLQILDKVKGENNGK